MRSRWNLWTVSKSQGSLLMTTQFEMQCFRHSAKGRWFTAKGCKCNIIPGGWRDLLQGSSCSSALASEWTPKTGQSCWPLETFDWHHPSGSLISWRGWCSLEKSELVVNSAPHKQKVSSLLSLIWSRSLLRILLQTNFCQLAETLPRQEMIEFPLNWFC